MKSQAIVPVVFAALVITLGATLIIIGARSPYTHANRDLGPDSGYTRTEQTLVGPPQPYVSPGAAKPAPSAADLASRGAQLLITAGCATCHGIDGRGGVFAPPIRGFDASTIELKTQTGPGGMPVFADLTDDDIQAIAAFLDARTTQPPTTASQSGK